MKGKQFNLISIGIAWLVSLGLVFILGILSAFAFHLAPGASNGAGSDLTLEQREMVLVLERYTGKPGDIAEIMAVGDSQGLSEQLDQALRAILRESKPDARMMAADRLVRGLPTRRVMACIRFLQKTPSNPARNQVLGKFLEVWAEQDGRSAIIFSTSLDSLFERQLAMQSALRGWSINRPSDAWNWVIEQEGTSRRAERMLEVILASLGSSNRETALSLLEKMPSSEFQTRMSVVVIEQILQTASPREAINWLSELPSSTTMEAGAHLAEVWAQTEPAAAANWLKEAFPGQVAGLYPVVREWVYLNPSAAADWVWESFPSSIRSNLMEIVADEWTANDGPSPLAQWLNTKGPDYSLDGAIEILALATASFDPATALVWAQSILDPDNRSMLEIVIGREWIRRAPDQAADNLPMLLESEAARAALLEPEYYEEDTGIIDSSLPLDEESPPFQ